MALYSVSVPIAFPNTLPADSPFAELVAGATDRPRLMELSYMVSATSSAAVRLGRPPVSGVGSQSSYVFKPDDPTSPPSTVQIVTLWNTPPTKPSIWLRQATVQNVIGGNIVWLFRKGLTIPASGSLVLWNSSSVVAGWVHAVIDI
jgi:hypothetical protein